MCVFSRGEPDESIGTIADTRMNHQYPQTCFGSSEYELALILKELRWITDQVNNFGSLHSLSPPSLWRSTSFILMEEEKKMPKSHTQHLSDLIYYGI